MFPSDKDNNPVIHDAEMDRVGNETGPVITFKPLLNSGVEVNFGLALIVMKLLSDVPNVVSPEICKEPVVFILYAISPSSNVCNLDHLLALDNCTPNGRLLIQDASIDLLGKLTEPDSTTKPLFNVGDAFIVNVCADVEPMVVLRSKEITPAV